MGFCNCSIFLVRYFVAIQGCNHLDVEERAGCFALFVCLVSRDCCVALPRDVTGLSVVCGLWYLLIILTYYYLGLGPNVDQNH